MYFVHRDHQLYYETHVPQSNGRQKGEPVILLHHGLGSVRAWKEQLPALVEAGYRAAAYDRWGYGASDPRPRLALPYFEEDLEDLSVLLDELGAKQVHLVGHSDGGTIALYYAAAHPERVKSLVTIAAHIYVEPKMVPGIEGLRQTFEKDHRFREGLRRVHGEKFESVFWNWYQGWRQEQHLHWDMRSSLKNILCPALVVQGSEDEHATPQHAQDIAAAIPAAELWLEPGGGHMLPQERPAQFNERLIRFLSCLAQVP